VTAACRRSSAKSRGWRPRSGSGMRGETRRSTDARGCRNGSRGRSGPSALTSSARSRLSRIAKPACRFSRALPPRFSHRRLWKSGLRRASSRSFLGELLIAEVGHPSRAGRLSTEGRLRPTASPGRRPPPTRTLASAAWLHHPAPHEPRRLRSRTIAARDRAERTQPVQVRPRARRTPRGGSPRRRIAPLDAKGQRLREPAPVDV
jgi:hypothetical protein